MSCTDYCKRRFEADVDVESIFIVVIPCQSIVSGAVRLSSTKSFFTLTLRLCCPARYGQAATTRSPPSNLKASDLVKNANYGAGKDKTKPRKKNGRMRIAFASRTTRLFLTHVSIAGPVQSSKANMMNFLFPVFWTKRELFDQAK